MVAILGYSREQITSAVQDMYTQVANAPQSRFHFPVGYRALSALGYPENQIEQLPGDIAASFAGVGYPFNGGAIRTGDTTLDLGAGAGNDSFLALSLTGPTGRVISLDLTSAMTRKLKQRANEEGASIEVIQGTAEHLPFASNSLDSITSNGALNLVPDKRRAIREMFRTLKPGGRLQLADVVIDKPVTVDCDSDPRLWVECVVGATVEESLLAMLEDAGFEDIRIIRRINYFDHSPSHQTREIAKSFGARSIEIAARRGSQPPGFLRQWLRRSHPKRWLTALGKRGFLSIAALGLALLTCYGILAATFLLATLGVQVTLDLQLWSGSIAVFTALTVLAVATGKRRHHQLAPTWAAVAGAGLVFFTLFVTYLFIIELVGFIMLIGAVFWDLILRRKDEARRLGLTR
ncbi:methyltransferase domain-containing protein [Marinobacter sp. NP-4(2019)]|uniref:methyltransferase domain-containing protein n=1 Tax=Marinobacter sp. NP-4(2019) TaxID=2488665 RepID=UPI000FC3D995|nr:methyltransferase domain-containing protein [Marinobacter sp. NP-4(2019)]AZT83169.1 methyltransferase domain-containing protein [Marinobacter sp. NP-4(2019)]